MSKFQRIYWSRKFDWKHYSGLYDKYCKSKNNYYIQSALELAESVKLRKTSKVIDIGCGTGALTKQLLKKYPRINILAIDLSKEMLSFFQKNFSTQIKNCQIISICGNAEKINEYTNEKYDAIFISSALWDMDIETTFKNIKKVLKKDGLVVFNLPALVVEKERGFIFFIEHFFRQILNSKIIYRRIKIDYLKKLFKKYNFQPVTFREYSFKMSKSNVSHFFDLLRYRYPFILFPKEMPYNIKLKRCAEIFDESLKYIPREGIDEIGFIFTVKKK